MQTRKSQLSVLFAALSVTFAALASDPSTTDLSVSIICKPNLPHSNDRISCEIALDNTTDHIVIYGRDDPGEIKVDLLDITGVNQETDRDSHPSAPPPPGRRMVHYLKPAERASFKLPLHTAHDRLKPGDYQLRIGILVKDAKQYAFSNTVKLSVLP